MSDTTVEESQTTDSLVKTLENFYVSPPFSPWGQRKGFDWEYASKRCDSVMDYNDPSQRRYSQNAYAAVQEHQDQQQQQQQQQEQHQQQSQRQREQHQQRHESSETPDHFNTPASLEHFRHSTILQETPTAPSVTPRAASESNVYAFGHGTQYGGGTVEAPPMQYATDLQAAEDQRQADASPYSQYGSNLMYGVGHAHAQQHSTQPSYDPVTQFRYRVSAPSGSMAHGLAMSPTGQYYLTGQAGPSSAQTADFKYPQITPHFQLPSAYAPVSSSATQAHMGTLLLSSSQTAYPAYAQETNASTMQSGTAAGMLSLSEYQKQLRVVFTHVANRSIREVGSPLLHLSYNLLNNVEPLGLTKDDDNQHNDQVQLWDDFNRAWLTTLQAQYDLTQEWSNTGQPTSVLTVEELEQLGSELVRLCDGLERHGLVDYQMGVAEDEIVDLLLRCLSLLQPPSRASSDTDMPEAESSAAAAARGH